MLLCRNAAALLLATGLTLAALPSIAEDAPMLDAEFMDEVMNPFEFAARMWRGAAAMVALQEDELGGQIDLTGEELANIIAFVHDAEEQMKFSMSDVPEAIEEMMHHVSEDDHHMEGEEDDHG